MGQPADGGAGNEGLSFRPRRRENWNCATCAGASARVNEAIQSAAARWRCEKGNTRARQAGGGGGLWIRFLENSCLRLFLGRGP